MNLPAAPTPEMMSLHGEAGWRFDVCRQEQTPYRRPATIAGGTRSRVQGVVTPLPDGDDGGTA